MRWMWAAPVAATMLVACKSDQDLVGDNEEPDPPLVAACIEVDPPYLNFGALEVMVDVAQTEIVTIRNTCEGDLEIYGHTLEDADAPYELGTLGAIRLAQGSSTDFTVTFDPLTSATWDTKVLIDNNDPETPVATVDLLGEGIAPVIEVTPETHDFGDPFIGCALEQPYTIRNVGNATLIVDELDFATGSPDFEFVSDHALPIEIIPGDAVEVTVRYLGLDEFREEAFLTVRSNDPWTPEVLVTATGQAKKFRDNDDLFEQPLRSGTDILFVVDNSCSMSEEQASLADNFEYFVDTLIDAESDYRLAVITTDDPSFRGPIIDNDTSDAIAEFQSQALAGVMGSADEKGLEMAWMATQTGGDAGPGGDFMRDESTLSVVILSDEEDYSAAAPNFYVNYWLGLKDNNPELVKVHAIAGEIPNPSCNTAAAAYRYDTAVQLTDGEFVSICATDWGANLETVALGSISQYHSFPLTEEPVPQTIEVVIDGIVTTMGWTYDAAANAIDFEADSLPPGGSTIEIHYEVMPACET